LATRLALTFNRPPQNEVLAVARPLRRARTVKATRPFEFVFAPRLKPGPFRRTVAPRTECPPFVSLAFTDVFRPPLTRTRFDFVRALQAFPPGAPAAVAGQTRLSTRST
jgi:hypothetical protein